MKNSSCLSTIFDIQFFLGIGILFLLGNGIFRINSDIFNFSLIIALFLIFPYISLTTINHFRTKQIRKKLISQNKQKFESLSKNGTLLEIELNERSLIIKPFSPIKNTDLMLIKETLGLSIFDIFKPKQHKQEYCIVKITYTIADSIYYKTFPLPFNKENASIVLGVQGKVNLYYDLKDHRNSILDLRFLQVHNLSYI